MKLFIPNLFSGTYQSRFKQLLFLFLLLLSTGPQLFGQGTSELNTAWYCAPAQDVKVSGVQISTPGYNIAGWMPATVPGTVLTTLLNNEKVPDPFYGLNNEQIPDIYTTGPGRYTYWFVKDFKEARPAKGGQVYLNLRGVNYSFNIYLNGHQLNRSPEEGMFLRRSFNITPYITDGNNRLAIIVYPAPVAGNPNGGQGGDGTIARNAGLQYTAGWDWIQPVRDRNTGIWDRVTIERTGPVRILDPHVVTLVPGIRQPDGVQAPAIIQVSGTLDNTSAGNVSGTASFEMGGSTVSKAVVLKPGSNTIAFNDYSFKNPKLWWPNGYGPQNLYNLKISFKANGRLSDQKNVEVGIREIQTSFNDHTGSRQIAVNGQKIFIKGGNWIISDEMLRLSAARYDAEVRFHHDMNLNLIRVWGGAMIERPEFYAACDKYGLLVVQDFWGSGDCNGRWQDPMKKDDQWTRRKYPDDHSLFLASAADQVKMIRNYASLAIWCGGNEITPPEDILIALRDSILPKLDNTRWFVDYSNSDAMSHNTLGGNGDGPYGIQPLTEFWAHRTFPFNSEVGSVGIGDLESLKRFIPEENLDYPAYDDKTGRAQVNHVWDYHKYIGYDTSISRYGKIRNTEDFAFKAQLVNYDQYRGLAEGFTAHMWDWYTGFIIWKTQNPWTAMRGQMYDYYLDPNACLYGLHNGSEPLHVMYNPVDGMVMLANNTFKARRSIMLVVKAYNMAGKDSLITQVFVDIGASATKKYFSVKRTIDALAAKEGIFLSLQLLDENKRLITGNLYWIADGKGYYSGLEAMKPAGLKVQPKVVKPGVIEVTLTNPANGPLAFFNRLSLTGADKKRLLPVFYDDNYLSVYRANKKQYLYITRRIVKAQCCLSWKAGTHLNNISP